MRKLGGVDMAFERYYPEGKSKFRGVKLNEKFSLKGEIGTHRSKINFQSEYHPLNREGLSEDFRAKMHNDEAHYDRIMVHPDEKRFVDIVTEKKGLAEYETKLSHIRYNEKTGKFETIREDVLGVSPSADSAREFHRSAISALMKSKRFEEILDRMREKH